MKKITAVAVGGAGSLHQAPPPRSRHPPDQAPPWEQVPPGTRPPDQAPPGTRPPPGSGTPSWEQAPPLFVNRHTPVNILPCPKLRLRAVINVRADDWTAERVIIDSKDSLVFVWIVYASVRGRSLEQGNILCGVCQEFCSQGGSGSQHALQVVSQQALLQVSKGGLQAHTQGGSCGVWPGRVSRPTPRGKWVSRPTPWGVCVSQHALRQTPPPPWTATAAGGTHPTGMHHCLFLHFFLQETQTSGCK